MTAISELSMTDLLEMTDDVLALIVPKLSTADQRTLLHYRPREIHWINSRVYYSLLSKIGEWSLRGERLKHQLPAVDMKKLVDVPDFVKELAIDASYANTK